jgi:hypothetical protein
VRTPRAFAGVCRTPWCYDPQAAELRYTWADTSEGLSSHVAERRRRCRTGTSIPAGGVRHPRSASIKSCCRPSFCAQPASGTFGLNNQSRRTCASVGWLRSWRSGNCAPRHDRHFKRPTPASAAKPIDALLNGAGSAIGADRKCSSCTKIERLRRAAYLLRTYFFVFLSMRR